MGSIEKACKNYITSSLLNCHELSFRGYQERIGDIYNGNFLSEVELLAEFDPIVNDIINFIFIYFVETNFSVML